MAFTTSKVERSDGDSEFGVFDENDRRVGFYYRWDDMDGFEPEGLLLEDPKLRKLPWPTGLNATATKRAIAALA